MWENLLLALAIRFFLFDFILFKRVREKLNGKHYIFKKLFSCTFCQGFWCGLVLLMGKSRLDIGSSLQFAFISAIVSFTWTVIMDPFIKRFEDHRTLPMT